MHYPVIHANPVIWVYRYWDRCLRSLNRRIIAKESKQSVTIYIILRELQLKVQRSVDKSTQKCCMGSILPILRHFRNNNCTILKFQINLNFYGPSWTLLKSRYRDAPKWLGNSGSRFTKFKTLLSQPLTVTFPMRNCDSRAW